MDRRKHTRVSVDLGVNYSIHHEARAINLCESGIRLKVKKMLTIGTILFMIIYLPDYELKVIGEVRWSKSDSNGSFENGVEFFFIDSINKKKIRDYIDIRDKQCCSLPDPN